MTVFCTCTSKKESCLASSKAAGQLGIRLKVFNVSEEYLSIVKNPAHGYGRNLNPCIDCRIFMFGKAHDYMKKIGASFIVTGEVLGERPMSQRMHTLKLIERESGLKGSILRPLSAKLLEPTIPEKKGWVDREKFLAISGRSRKPQISLVKEYGIKDYPCPAGGCLLTDPGFAGRMSDLMKYNPDFDLNDVKLLKLGRHFRLSDNAKLIVGRNKEENPKIAGLTRDEDIIIDAQNIPGPLALLRGEVQSWEIEYAAALTATFSKGKDLLNVGLIIRQANRDNERVISVAPPSIGTKYSVPKRI